MIAKLGLALLFVAISATGYVLEDPETRATCGAAIVAAARSKIGTPYVFGGGDKNGPTKGGFDCSGLTIYSVYQGTGRGKIIPRVSKQQYTTTLCKAIKVGDRQLGDLVFWGSSQGVYHVAIVSGTNKVIHAPKPGDKVKEAALWTKDLMPTARRCC